MTQKHVWHGIGFFGVFAGVLFFLLSAGDAVRAANGPATGTAPASAPGAILRVAAGRSAPYKDAQGNTWDADRGFEGGAAVEHPGLKVTGTNDPGLYCAERYSTFSYTFQVPNGTYVVRLHFCESYEGNTTPDDRLFTFDVQGQTYKNFSPFKMAGGQFKAYVETVKNVKVSAGQIKIAFTPQVQLPQINGIEIYPAGTYVEQGPVKGHPLLGQLVGDAKEPVALDAARANLSREDIAALLEQPAISLKARDASFKEVASQLSKALNQTMEVAAWSNPTGTFTLDAQNQPFWNIFDQLSRQHVIAPAATEPLMLYAGTAVPRSGQIHKPPQEPRYRSDCGFVSFSRGTRKQMPQGSTPQLKAGELAFDFTLAADPRLLIWNLAWTDQSMAAGDRKLAITWSMKDGSPSFFRPRSVWEQFLFARVPEELGGQKATLRVQARATVVLAENHKELIEPEKHLNETIALPGGEFQLKSFATNNGHSINLSIAKMTPGFRLMMGIYDTKGLFALMPVGGNTTIGIGKECVPPVTLRFSAPKVTLDVDIPIELDYEL
jgi:hypothetical protein